MTNKTVKSAGTILLDIYLESTIPWETRIRTALLSISDPDRCGVLASSSRKPPRNIAPGGLALAW